MRLFALFLLLALPLSASGQEQEVGERSTLSVRATIGSSGLEGTVGTFGASVLARVSPRFGVTLAGRSWNFETDCPDVIPATCGDDGRSLTGGVRVALLPARSWTPFVEGQMGRYWFSSDARDGDATSSAGVRGGFAWILESGVEVELAAQLQRLSGYEEGGLEFPAVEIKGLQFGVGIPIL